MVNNETNPDITDRYRTGSLPNNSRLLNFAVSHRVMMFNYWSAARIIQCQTLWLIIRKNTNTETYEIVPWTSPNHAMPPLKYLLPAPPNPKFVNDIGVALYVGKSSDQRHHLQTGSRAFHTATPTNLNRTLMKQGIILEPLEVQLLL